MAADGNEKLVLLIILIVGAYVGSFFGSLILKNKEEGTTFNIALYGSVGWVAALLSGYFGLPDLTEFGIVIGTVIFAIFGMVSYLIFTLLDRSSD